MSHCSLAVPSLVLFACFSACGGGSNELEEPTAAAACRAVGHLAGCSRRAVSSIQGKLIGTETRIGSPVATSDRADRELSKPSFKEESMEQSALVVKVRVKAEYREQFLEQMLADAIGSEKNEPGCLMFNIVRDNADPNVLHLFEVYEDDKAVEAHKKAPHFLKWLETTKDWLAAPLEIARCTTVYPPIGAWKKRPAP